MMRLQGWRTWRISIMVAYGGVVIALVGLYSTDRARRQQTKENCVHILEQADETDVRGRILRTFLVTAAGAREHIAVEDIRLGRPVEARINRHAAKLWRKLAAEVGNVRRPDCKGG